MTEATVTYKTCLVRVVEPGMPDRVIKIYPALHENEKIWLDHRPGIERWAAVEQLMERFCPRGKYVPKAAYLHQPGAKPEDVNTIIIEPKDYPVAELDGAVFEPLPKQERARFNKPDEAKKAAEDRMAKLEDQVGKLTELLTAVVSKQVAPAPVAAADPAPKKRGRPRKEPTQA